MEANYDGMNIFFFRQFQGLGKFMSFLSYEHWIDKMSEEELGGGAVNKVRCRRREQVKVEVKKEEVEVEQWLRGGGQ